MKIGIANDHSAVDMKKAGGRVSCGKKDMKLSITELILMRAVLIRNMGKRLEKQLQTEKWISELQSVEPVLEFPWRHQ